MSVNLPDDLRSFLERGEQLRYDTDFCEPGQAELLRLDQVSLGQVWIPARYEWDAQDDPHAGEEGYYYLPAVNLVAKAEGYDPEYILLWLPEDRIYGTWDNEHYRLTVYPGVTWSDIAANPRPYIVSQWEDDEPGVEFVPRSNHIFTPGPLSPRDRREQ